MARQLIAAGYPVVPGDRVEMLFLVSEDDGRADKAFPARLYDPTRHAIDFAFYARYITGPFERALQYTIRDEALRKRLWNVDAYERLVPSATSGRFGPMASVLNLAPQVYQRRRPSVMARPDVARPLKQTRFA